ncbi:MAG: hypothetical protein QXV16_02750 [Candidatus Anstonellales archaeon]
MRDVLYNIITMASNGFLFITTLLMIKFLSVQEMAIYFYSLSIYTILSLLTNLYFSKVAREIALSHQPEHMIRGYVGVIYIFSIIVSLTTSIIASSPLSLMFNFIVWHIIDYTNNLLSIIMHPKRIISIVLPRVIRTAVAVILIFLGQFNLDNFLWLSSLLAILTFSIINLKILLPDSLLSPKVDIKNLGMFIDSIFGTLLHNIDNIIMKDVKGFDEYSFTNINYITNYLKYVSGIFYGITFPFLLQDLRKFSRIKINNLILHFSLPMALFYITIIMLFIIYNTLIQIDMRMMSNYFNLVIAFSMISFTIAIRNILVALDYKKPLVVLEFISTMIYLIMLIFGLDSSEPFTSYSNTLFHYSIITFLIYLLFSLRILPRFIQF